MNDFDEDHDPYDMDLAAPSGSGGGAGSSSEVHRETAGASPTQTPTARRPRRPRQDSNDGVDGAQLPSLDSQQEISSTGYAAAFDDLQHQHHQAQEAAGGLSLADELGGLGSPAADEEPQYEASSLADEMTRLSTFTVRPERVAALPGSTAALDDPDFTSGVPRSTHASHDSTYTNHESAAAHDDEAAEARARQQEAQLQDLAKSITESVHHTDSFLAKLRGPDRPAAAAAAAPGPFITSRSPAHAAAAQHDIDRLEAVGIAIGISLRDQAEQRLAQVRELRDIERALSRDDPKLWMALAHVVGSAAVAAAQQVNGDAIDEQDEEEDAMLDLETALAPPAPQDVLGYTRDPPSSSSTTTPQHPDAANTTTTYDDLRGPSLRSSPLSTHLSHLSHLTTSLNDSLRSVSESLQISAASSREAAKRLRALKKGVDEVKGQEDELERCRRGIEREQAEDGAAGERRRRRSEAVKREMEGLRVAFERVEGQVREKGWGKMVGSEMMDGRLDEVKRQGGWPEGYRRVVKQFPGVAGLV